MNVQTEDVEQTGEIIDVFASELKERLGQNILGVYLFGSSAKGTSTEKSDIDVLIVYSGIDEWGVLQVASELTFRIACDEGRLIEIVTMSKEEFESSLGSSPFLWEVLNFGKPVFTTLSGTDWELDFGDYLDLAEEYFNYSKDALSEDKLRLSIDSGYNACELLVKALIISTRNSLASSHGGIVGQFGKLFVLANRVPEHLGRNLNIGLELRAKARYRPGVQVQRSDAEFVINLAEELLSVARKQLNP